MNEPRNITVDDMADGDRAIATDAGGGRDAVVERFNGRVYFVSWRDESAADMNIDTLPVIQAGPQIQPDRV